MSPPPESGPQAEAWVEVMQSPSITSLLLEQSRDGVLAFDRACRYVVWNPEMERISGCPAADVLGQCAFDVFPFLRDIGEDEHFARALTGEPSVTRDRKFSVPAAGRTGVFEGYYSPVRHGDDIIGGLAIIREVTDAKEREAELRRAQRMEAVALLASEVAHDFNNILAGVLGHAHLVRDQIPLDSTTRWDLDQMVEGGERAAALVRSLMSVARGDEPADAIGPQDVARDVIGLLGPVLGENVRIRLEVDHRTPAVAMGTTDLTQVLLNLLVNARDAMPAGGRVTVSVLGATSIADPGPKTHRLGVAPAGAHVCVQVADEGEGIGPADLPRIFDPFFSTKGKRGTGLGLGAIRRLVLAHGGAIDVTSELGRGTSFRIYLPAADPAVVPPKDPSPAAQTVRVLVVERDPLVQTVIERALAGGGYAAELCDDPGGALERVRSNPAGYALVLADLLLPRMNAFELRTRVHEVAPQLPVLAMTGHGSRRLAALGVDLEAEEVLHKPFSPAELLAMVRARVQC